MCVVFGPRKWGGGGQGAWGVFTTAHTCTRHIDRGQGGGLRHVSGQKGGGLRHVSGKRGGGVLGTCQVKRGGGVLGTCQVKGGGGS